MTTNKHPEDLEDFLCKEVASLCDADPKVLAQYIAALIGNEPLNDTLRNSLLDKLNEFFDDQTIPFIDRLFAKLSGTSSSETTAGTTDRFEVYSDEEEDGDRNFKHRRQRSGSREEHKDDRHKRRLPDDENTGSSNKFVRGEDYSNRRTSSNSSSGSFMYNTMNPNTNNTHNHNSQPFDGRGRGRGNRGRGGMMNRGQPRPQCRDYNEKGFCMRGDMCPYDHGMDRIVVDDNVNPFPGPFPGNGPIPTLARAVPQPFFPIPADAYDPERAGLLPTHDMNNFNIGMMNPDMNPMMHMNNTMMNTNNRGTLNRRGRGGRGGRGGYQSGAYRNQNNSTNTTLTVEKIPPEFCQISTVNDFFAKFGTITNISVQPQGQRAIIQYSTRAEAENAYSSPDAIFDNRFVKVYWHKEDAVPPTAPTNTNGTESNPVASGINPNEPDPQLVAARAAELAKEREEKQKKHQEHMKTILDLQKKREQQLQQQIDEQKRLLAKLSDSANMTQSEKAELLRALKAIQSDIATSKSAANDVSSQPIAAPQPTPSQPTGSHVTHSDSQETENKEETTEDLKLKLARLEAEAATLGIHSKAGRGGYYPRGGVRGGWPRARGGLTRMSLDNRPTKILVKDIPSEINPTELREHFDQYGTISLFEPKEAELLVQYSQRFEAEKAMAVGSNFNGTNLQLNWYTEPSHNHTTTES
ncbi:hypothetical protein BDB01DRAFT_774444 [Pilobolus umbonatus]|nr:hypothetical protein BDB01DRAFT_774444 [Pilobolus umbonatus]